MALLDFAVSGQNGGTYGSKPYSELTNGQTFGSWGAALCVILLVQKSDDSLFCGHMSCGISGLPGNQAIIMQRATELLNAALGEGNKGQPWTAVTNGGREKTSTWMVQAMTAWFTKSAGAVITNQEDGYFAQVNGEPPTIMATNEMSGPNPDNPIINDGQFNIAQ